MMKYKNVRAYHKTHSKLMRLKRTFDLDITRLLDQLADHALKHGKDFIQ